MTPHLQTGELLIITTVLLLWAGQPACVCFCACVGAWMCRFVCVQIRALHVSCEHENKDIHTFSFFFTSSCSLCPRHHPPKPSSPSSADSTTSSKTTTPTAPRRKPRGRWSAPLPTTTPQSAAHLSTTTEPYAAAG